MDIAYKKLKIEVHDQLQKEKRDKLTPIASGSAIDPATTTFEWQDQPDEVDFENFLSENASAMRTFIRRGYLAHTELRNPKGSFDYVALRDFNWVSWKKMCITMGIQKYETKVVEMKEMLYANFRNDSNLSEEQHNTQFNALLDHALNEYLNVYKYPTDYANYF